MKRLNIPLRFHIISLFNIFKYPIDTEIVSDVNLTVMLCLRYSRFKCLSKQSISTHEYCVILMIDEKLTPVCRQLSRYRRPHLNSITNSTYQSWFYTTQPRCSMSRQSVISRCLFL